MNFEQFYPLMKGINWNYLDFGKTQECRTKKALKEIRRSTKGNKLGPLVIGRVQPLSEKQGGLAAATMAGLTVTSGPPWEQVRVFSGIRKTSDMKTPMQIFNQKGKVETQMQPLKLCQKKLKTGLNLTILQTRWGALFKGAGFETQEALDLSSMKGRLMLHLLWESTHRMEAVAGAAKR